MIELHLVSRWEPTRVMPVLDDLRGLLRQYADAWPQADSFESICRAIDDGETQLWAMFEDGTPKFVILGKLLTTASGFTHYEIMVGAGEFRDGEIRQLADIERYAAKRGAHAVEFTTRPGLGRLLKRHGYGQILERVRKPLERLQ